MHLISDAGWATFCRASTNQVQGMTLARVSAESGNHQLVSDNNLAFYYIYLHSGSLEMDIYSLFSSHSPRG